VGTAVDGFVPPIIVALSALALMPVHPIRAVKVWQAAL